jgi:arylformamidase
MVKDDIDKKVKNNSDVIITISRSIFYDLTNLIRTNMAIYPGDPVPDFEPVATIEKDKLNVTRIVMGSHTGTHVDAEKHFISNGKGIDKEPLDKFIGEAIILDMSAKDIGQGITDVDLNNHYNKYLETLTKFNTYGSNILLLYTGTSNKLTIDNNSATNSFTYLEPSAADWIVDHNIKCVGIDTFSVEKYGFKEGLTHKKLLSSGIGIIENLNSNLKEFVGKTMFLVCLPLLLENIDGSPARTILFDIIR